MVQLTAPDGRKNLIGALVDAVEEVIQLNDESIEPAPDFGDPQDTQYILGVTTGQDGVKTLLDINKIFTDDFSATRPLAEGAAKHQSEVLS